MTFLQPLLLLALLTLPLILVLHLLRERRQRTVVPSLLHWANLPRRREGRRMRRLPVTLLLLLHLLAAALLGLAAGRPQLRLGALGEAPDVAIVLDISTSMAAEEGGVTRFSRAQTQARAVLRSLQSDAQAVLIAAGPRARIVGRGGPGELPALESTLADLQPGGTGTDLAGALALADAALHPQRDRRIIVLSDSAVPAVDVPAPAAPVEWRQIGDSLANRAIVAFAARPWGGKLQVFARVANYDAAPFDVTLQLYGDGRRLAARAASIAANGESELTWTLPGGYTTLRAAVDGRDALPLDDQAYLSASASRPVDVLLVSEQPGELQRALESIREVSLSTIAPGAYAEAAPADLTIFDGYLPDAWPASPVLAINPPPGSALLAVEPGARSAAAGEVIQRGPVLEGLSFGGASFGDVRQVAPPSWVEIRLARGAVPLILRGRSSGQEVAIWTFDLASGNLPSRLAFPLLVARTVHDLAPAPLPAAIQSGAPLALRPDSRADQVRVEMPDGEQLLLPASVTLSVEELGQPGLYRVEERGQGRLLYAGKVGVNAGAAVESDLRPQAAPQFEAAPVGGEERRRPLELWPWLALGAIGVLLLEWMYLHR